MSIAVRSDTPANHHNALEVHAPTGSTGLVRIVEWAQAADAAFKLADMFVNSTMAPQAYRGKPHEAAAAILAGAELGFDPMASLRAFDNIQGTPAPKAITLRAVVQAAGHHIRIDRSTPTEAVVSGLRKGDAEWQTSTWTIQRATQMGLTGKPEWKKQPGAMLVARATSEVCRWIASDAIMGMPYSAEEIRDEDGGVFEPRPAARRVTAAEVLESRPISAQPVTDTTEPVDAADAEQPQREPMTRPQQGKMHALFNEVGIGDRESRMQYVNEILSDEFGRTVSSSSELSKDEASSVIDHLKKWADGLQPTADEIADAAGDVR